MMLHKCFKEKPVNNQHHFACSDLLDAVNVRIIIYITNLVIWYKWLTVVCYK